MNQPTSRSTICRAPQAGRQPSPVGQLPSGFPSHWAAFRQRQRNRYASFPLLRHLTSSAFKEARTCVTGTTGKPSAAPRVRGS